MAGSAMEEPSQPAVQFDDDFYMYRAKVEPCPRQDVHSYSSCPYLHPNEPAQRRDPRVFRYDPIFCYDLHNTKACKRGLACPYSHSQWEYFLHPKRYRTRMCEFGSACKRPLCFFAHDESQLRPSTTIKEHSGGRRSGRAHRAAASAALEEAAASAAVAAVCGAVGSPGPVFVLQAPHLPAGDCKSSGSGLSSAQMTQQDAVTEALALQLGIGAVAAARSYGASSQHGSPTASGVGMMAATGSPALSGDFHQHQQQAQHSAYVLQHSSQGYVGSALDVGGAMGVGMQQQQQLPVFAASSTTQAQMVPVSYVQLPAPAAVPMSAAQYSSSPVLMGSGGAVTAALCTQQPQMMVMALPGMMHHNNSPLIMPSQQQLQHQSGVYAATTTSQQQMMMVGGGGPQAAPAYMPAAGTAVYGPTSAGFGQGAFLMGGAAADAAGAGQQYVLVPISDSSGEFSSVRGQMQQGLPQQQQQQQQLVLAPQFGGGISTVAATSSGIQGGDQQQQMMVVLQPTGYQQ